MFDFHKYNRDYYKKNKKKIKAATAKYAAEHRVAVLAYNQKYYQEHLKERAAYNNLPHIRKAARERAGAYYNQNRAMCIRKMVIRDAERYKTDETYRIEMRLRALVRAALRDYADGKKWSSSKYGIDYGKIMAQLGPMPKDGKTYHIDHIKPLCAFNLRRMSEIRAAFAPENHQWLEAHENEVKGGKYVH